MTNLKPYTGALLPFAVKIQVAECQPPRRLWHILDVPPGICCFCGTKIDAGDKKIEVSGHFWHPECFNCSLCGQRMDPSGVVPREDLIFHKECYKECYSERCCKCTKLIDSGEYFGAFGRAYHKNCYFCEKCNARQTQSSRVYNFYNIPYCAACFEDLMKLFPTCVTCRKPVLPTEKSKSFFWEGKKYFYHVPDCEKCQKCSKTPDNGGDVNKQVYCVVNNTLYCIPCYKEALQKVCASCNQPIFDQASKMENISWHGEHFKCSICNCSLKPNTCVFNFGILKCKSCATEDKPVCAGCGKPIQDEPITACRTIWHPQCLRCQFCDHSVLGKKFTNVSGFPCCRNCYEEKMQDGTIDRKTGQLKKRKHHSKKSSGSGKSHRH